MIERVPGIRNAPPMPCRTRNAINWPVLWARPHPAEATVKIASPARNIFLRPILSPTIPPVRSNDANAST